MTQATDTLVQVRAPHFTAAIVIRDGRCISAAPILKWCKRKTRDELRAYFAAKGWTAVVVSTTTGTVWP